MPKKIIIGIIILIASYFLVTKVVDLLRTKDWTFIGYQYRWNEDYVVHKNFSTEETCAEFGDNWLIKQSSEEALYTCSYDCKPWESVFEVCKKVCEYGVQGFIRCRD